MVTAQWQTDRSSAQDCVAGNYAALQRERDWRSAAAAAKLQHYKSTVHFGLALHECAEQPPECKCEGRHRQQTAAAQQLGARDGEAVEQNT